MKTEKNALIASPRRLFQSALLMFASSVLAFLPLLTACAAIVEEKKPDSSNASPGVEEQKKQPQDKGDFKVAYGPVRNRDYAQLQKDLQESKALEQIASGLNSQLALPFDITMTFTECGEMNAFYDPDKRQISMCYELIENFYEVFSKDTESQEEVEDAVVNATIFVFFHELGHALVHALELPITGKEEDAVDQLSTFILADGTDEGEKAALDGAASFIDEEEDVDNLAFWDEHSLGRQRFYNIVCWVYGQNPAKFEFLVKEGVLPQERAVRCEEEYKQLARSWSKLLEPYMKK